MVVALRIILPEVYIKRVKSRFEIVKEKGVLSSGAKVLITGVPVPPPKVVPSIL